jgi:hypothetical protein
MVWTISSAGVIANRYRLSGKTLSWSLITEGSTFGGTIQYYFYVYLPSTYACAPNGVQQNTSVHRLYVGGSLIPSMSANGASARFLTITPIAPVAYVAGTLQMAFNIQLELT